MTEMLAYQKIEPFGPMRDNYHAGLIASILYNANRARGRPARKPSDFILRDLVEDREEKTADLIGMLRAFGKRKET